MSAFLTVAAAAVLLTALVGLVRLKRAAHDIDRIMSVQLLTTGVIAGLLLVSAATPTAGAVDLAITLAIVGPMATVGFVGARGALVSGGGAATDARRREESP